MKREEIDNKYKWNMKDVYESDDIWEKDYEKADKLIDNLLSYKGNICKSKESFRDFLTEYFDTMYVVDKLYFYAGQRYHEDLSNPEYQMLYGKVGNLLNIFSAKLSFVEPEILSEGEEKIKKYLDEDLSVYKQFFDNLFREKKHVLSEKEEELLAKTRDFSGGFSEIFSMLNNADIKFLDVTDKDGKTYPLTHGTYIKYMESDDRVLRKDAFEKMYKSFYALKNTVANIYINNLKKNSFYSKIRGFSSTMEMFLDGSNIPVKVYDTLLDVVSENLNELHRYVGLRKKLLKLDSLHMYDLYIPLIKTDEKDIPYEKACEMVLSGLKPMGDEYLGILKEGFDNNWIDVYENEGKRSGAYSWSVYGVHPYVLLNYQPNLNSVFTIAHEMGHALHSYYSNKNQAYVNADYKIFVAEIASTCNEALLIKDLLEKTEDKNKKAYYINYLLEQFRTTLFRQTMFAEFEKIVHEKTDNGEVLNADALCEIYYNLNKKYFGDDIEIDKDIEMEWARIPHFYTDFYVYQYATSFCAAIALSDKILKEKESAVKEYKKFLSAGCSLYPIDIVKLAGIDMEKKEFIESAMEVFKSLIDELESLID